MTLPGKKAALQREEHRKNLDSLGLRAARGEDDGKNRTNRDSGWRKREPDVWTVCSVTQDREETRF